MSGDPSGFVAYTALVDTEEIAVVLDVALVSLGWSRSTAAQSPAASRLLETAGHAPPVRRVYERESGGRLPCLCGADREWTDRHGRRLCYWSFYPVRDEDIAQISNGAYVAAIAAGCIVTDAVFGRSWDAAGMDRPTETELHGAVDMLSWIQYFGPDMANHIGADRLTSAPFYAIERLGNDGYLARTRASYADDWPWAARRPLMDHLGLAPRRVVNPSTHEELRWC